jgi:ribosomal protein S18 acetylase RimI-like enzyme
MEILSSLSGKEVDFLGAPSELGRLLEDQNLQSFPRDWNSLADFLSDRPRIARVGFEKGFSKKKIRGLAVWSLRDLDRELHLDFLWVHPSRRRRGFGRLLVEDPEVERLVRNGRIVCRVPEILLDAQLFLRALGFKAVRILDEEKEGGRSLYEMERTASR